MAPSARTFVTTKNRTSEIYIYMAAWLYVWQILLGMATVCAHVVGASRSCFVCVKVSAIKDG